MLHSLKEKRRVGPEQRAWEYDSLGQAAFHCMAFAFWFSLLKGDSTSAERVIRTQMLLQIKRWIMVAGSG